MRVDAGKWGDVAKSGDAGKRKDGMERGRVEE
jgi:hypothetical protein